MHIVTAVLISLTGIGYPLSPIRAPIGASGAPRAASGSRPLDHQATGGRDRIDRLLAVLVLVLVLVKVLVKVELDSEEGGTERRDRIDREWGEVPRRLEEREREEW